MLPVAAEDVSVTEPPEQNVVGPEAATVGVVGVGFTVIVVAEDTDEQVPFETETVYVPETATVIDCVVSPFDQTLPVVAEEVSVTVFPEQNVVGPLAVTTGVAGAVCTVTAVVAETLVHPLPSETVTK